MPPIPPSNHPQHRPAHPNIHELFSLPFFSSSSSFFSISFLILESSSAHSLVELLLALTFPAHNLHSSLLTALPSPLFLSPSPLLTLSPCLPWLLPFSRSSPAFLGSLVSRLQSRYLFYVHRCFCSNGFLLLSYTVFYLLTCFPTFAALLTKSKLGCHYP